MLTKINELNWIDNHVSVPFWTLSELFQRRCVCQNFIWLFHFLTHKKNLIDMIKLDKFYFLFLSLSFPFPFPFLSLSGSRTSLFSLSIFSISILERQRSSWKWEEKIKKASFLTSFQPLEQQISLSTPLSSRQIAREPTETCVRVRVCVRNVGQNQAVSRRLITHFLTSLEVSEWSMQANE